MMFDTVASLLKQKKKPKLVGVAPSATVAEAVRTMNEEKVGATLVMNAQELVGIFTERDVLVRVVGAGRDPATTPIAAVMTAAVRTVAATTSIDAALRLMSEHRYRHLPVQENGRVLGLVSMGDVTSWVIRSQQEVVDGAIGAVKQMGMANRRG